MLRPLIGLLGNVLGGSYQVVTGRNTYMYLAEGFQHWLAGIHQVVSRYSASSQQADTKIGSQLQGSSTG